MNRLLLAEILCVLVCLRGLYDSPPMAACGGVTLLTLLGFRDIRKAIEKRHDR